MTTTTPREAIEKPYWFVPHLPDEVLADYALGGLGDQFPAIQEHLLACESCRITAECFCNAVSDLHLKPATSPKQHTTVFDCSPPEQEARWSKPPAIWKGISQSAAAKLGVSLGSTILCAERDYLLHQHQVAIDDLGASIRALVELVDNSAANLDFNLVHRRIGSVRWVCEVTRGALEKHQGEHGC